jgi:acylphosphatase
MNANPPESELVRVHIWVRGRVQGVGFRAYVQQAGAMFGLTGWVRNIGWSELETLAEGPRPQVEQFVEAVKRGPSVSRVDEARVEWERPMGEFRSFEVRSSR